MRNIAIIYEKFSNESLKNMVFVTSLLFIVGCSNGKIEISDIENSIVGEYSCQVKSWILPGSESFLYSYRSGDRNLIRTPYGIAYEVKQKVMHQFEGGSNFFEKIPNTLTISYLDDMNKITKTQGPYNWKLTNDNKGVLYFKSDELPYWRIDYSGLRVQYFSERVKHVHNIHCRRDDKEQEKTMILIEKFENQFKVK